MEGVQRQPLIHLRKFITLLDIAGGFTYAMDQFGNLQNNPWRFLRMIVPLLVGFCSPMMLLAANYAFTETNNFAFAQFSVMENVSGWMTTLIGSVISVSTFIILGCKRDDLQDLVDKISASADSFSLHGIGHTLNSLRKAHVMIGVIGGSIFVSFCMFLIEITDSWAPDIRRNHPVWFAFYILAGPFSILLTAFHPLTLSADAFVYFVIQFVTLHFREWRMTMMMATTTMPGTEEQLQKHSVPRTIAWVGEGKVVQPVKLAEVALVGLQLCDVVDTLNLALSELLLIQASMCMVTGTFSAFTAAGYFFKQNLSRAYLSITSALITVYVIGKMLYLCSAGQGLEDELYSCKKTLESCRNHQTVFANTSSSAASTLSSRLAILRPVTPRAFFTLNHRAFVAFASASFTYLIVLLQFRAEH